ncbi:MAG: hypothetical protein RMN24_10430 [Anaerolineae bacterium]|nr:hypothetical protein [Caldilineales bacterium]MCX7851484.1 hypothetical protein [Caldilineales bacterium]MDW8269569.1 hypothetical protein [Anaerolineae bacterium]
MRIPLWHRSRPVREHTWDVHDVVWLENNGDENLILHLPSGEFRLDRGRRQRFRADILQHPQVQALRDAGKITVRRASKAADPTRTG